MPIRYQQVGIDAHYPLLSTQWLPPPAAHRSTDRTGEVSVMGGRILMPEGLYPDGVVTAQTIVTVPAGRERPICNRLLIVPC